MDPIVIVVATAAGALLGTSVGILLLHRKFRPPITDAELASLKGKLQSSESSLSTTTASLDDLRTLMAQREKTIQQIGEDLKKRQQQLDLTSAEAQAETARRSAAEQRVQELSLQAIGLTEQCAKLDGKIKEESNLVAEKARQMTLLEALLDASEKQFRELTDRAALLTAESAELRRLSEQENRQRTSLEAQLSSEQERLRQLTTQVTELQGERSRFEIRLQEERQSAAKGLEFLLMAQEKLSMVFGPASAETTNDKNGHVAIEAAQLNPEAPVGVAEIALAATSSN